MRVFIIAAITLAMAIFSEPLRIYEWRGTGHTGVYPDKDLMKEWPAGGPEVVMKITDIGNGFVSPVFTENRFYLSGEVDSMTVLFCFDLNGKKQWQTVLAREWTKTWRGSRSAPAICRRPALHWKWIRQSLLHKMFGWESNMVKRTCS